MSPGDRMNRSLAKELIEAPARARELFPRGGFKGLDPAALQVLAVLGESQSRSVDEISRRLVLDASTVRHALAALRERGLATELVDESDGRRRPQAISAEGRRLLADFLDSVRSRT